MNKEEILAMEGNKLKAEVAQRIIGIKVEYPFAEGYPYYLREDKDGKMKWDIVPDYPGDISAAWQVKREMNRQGFHFRFADYDIEPIGRQQAIFSKPGFDDFVAIASKAPEAICKAALLASKGESMNGRSV